MKKILRAGLLLAFGTMCGAMIAGAQTVTMGFIGAEGNQSGGVYTFPYNFTIDGVGTYQLMCSSYNQHITNGESWVATTLSMASLDTNTVLTLEAPSAGVQGYLEAAYLFEEESSAFATSSDNEGLYNWAVWDLLTGTDASQTGPGTPLSVSDEAQVQSYIADAQAAGPGLTPSQFADVVIYTPIDMSETGPQEFFGLDTPVETVPEPGTLTLVGFGVLGMVGVGKARRKK
jgi:PEP-CTERM motif-containing protein